MEPTKQQLAAGRAARYRATLRANPWTESLPWAVALEVAEDDFANVAWQFHAEITAGDRRMGNRFATFLSDAEMRTRAILEAVRTLEPATLDKDGAVVADPRFAAELRIERRLEGRDPYTGAFDHSVHTPQCPTGPCWCGCDDSNPDNDPVVGPSGCESGQPVIVNLDGPDWRIDNETTYSDVNCSKCGDEIRGAMCGGCYGGW